MPLTIACDETKAADLDEVVEYMFENKISPEDQASLMEAAPMLRRLANNKSFLAEMVCEELKSYDTLQSSNNYSAQVFMLYRPQRKGQSFFMRACFWPSNADQVVKTSGTDPFFYNKPHDHNFNFLTVGYHGPGYWSDYFEYDYDQCDGVRGESVPLRFIEQSKLDTGKVLLYRAFTDIHNQLPADSFSVSLNIMENSMRASMMDQYAFDLQASKISDLINRTTSISLFNAAAALGNDEQKDVLRFIAQQHSIDRIRLSALDALAHSSTDQDEAIKVWASVKDSDTAFLRGWRKVRTTEIETFATAQLRA
ncbi:transposase [Luteimonas fraxinea]|uniref:transposase n=1 Tax=Luteimonas fraxinea TaxID=2901869 RepID=UPI001E3CEB5C|nr:transposase [Luteimonas fraxinea]UHH09653.1 transposase [Luteimonas fraxinea]